MSKYNSTKDLKITYFLGAGASFNSLPIWKAQGKSMVDVANIILFMIDTNPTNELKSEYPNLVKSPILVAFMNKLKKFGVFAQEFGSIDIYAKRLFLLGNNEELNELKYCLSVYFDLWENFLHTEFTLDNDTKYTKVDKRYFSLLSVLLEKRNNYPVMNKNVSFITWNYDLQLEMAYESFLPLKTNSLQDINVYFPYMENNLSEERSDRKIVHLNGFRGIFFEEEKIFETVEKHRCVSIEEYLNRLLSNYSQFKNPDFTNCIKYAWESKPEVLSIPKKIMEKTNILVIVGYSFPAFNRKIDSELIRCFEEGQGYKKVIYQDP